MPGEFWTEAVKQVPALAVVSVAMLLIIAWVLRSLRSTNSQFLEHITMMEDRSGKREAARDAAQALATARIAASMDRNTEALGLNTGALAVVASLNQQGVDLCKDFKDMRAEILMQYREVMNAHKETRHGVQDLHQTLKMVLEVWRVGQQIPLQAKNTTPTGHATE